MRTPPVKLLVVCMGNLCRSPMAQAVIAHRAASRPTLSLQVDSAGTRVGWPGVRPDPRATAALARRGYPLPGTSARPLRETDFDRYDLLLAMDDENMADMLALAPQAHRAKARMFLDFAPHLRTREVPDPYYGDAQGFERVLDLCEAGTQALLDALCRGGAVRRAR